VCSAAALFAASRLNRGYVGSLERSLADLAPGGAGIDPDEARTTVSGIRPSRLIRRDGIEPLPGRQPAPGAVRAAVDSRPPEPEMRDILSLRSRDRARIVEVLSRDEGLSRALVPHAITLLAWDPVADHALFALRKVAEEHVGQLVDALVDPNQDFAIRRRLVRVFSVCVSQRAALGVLVGLEDARFDVRYQSARSLAAILEKNPRVRIDSAQIFAVVLRELAVGRGVWESRRLLDGVDPGEDDSALDQFVRTRAGESLAHVFTLLSLVLPPQPLQIAFRSLQTDDERLQGTALEYLESVLPTDVRHRLWPFIVHRSVRRAGRPRDEVMAELLRSHHSILLNLESLRLRASAGAGSVAS
jgi:hypothetical protein